MHSGIYTAEAVMPGHPDKLCDTIADSILDAVKRRDPSARLGVEAAAKGRDVWVFGEITAAAGTLEAIDIPRIARRVYEDAGYAADWGLAPGELRVRVDVSEQSAELANNVRSGSAGDQGSAVGYAIACPWANYLPPEYFLANSLVRALSDARRLGRIPCLGPDGKSQVTLRCKDHGELAPLIIVLSAQHRPGSLGTLRAGLRGIAEEVLADVERLGGPPCSIHRCEVLINPAGSFVAGGPIADAGLTGRKTVADSYGPRVPAGGGSFSGKDGTKINRSGAYAARHAAKSIVVSELARECMIRLDYAIGRVQPLNTSVWLDGLQVTSDEARELLSGFDFSPGGITERLELNSISHARQAAFGHFVFQDLPWEKPVRIPAGQATG